MITAILLCLLGFVALIIGAEFLISGSSSLAKRMNVSEIAIGLTIVAFGTSMPELVVNVFASLHGNNEIALGNVIGSNIFNIFFILGIAGLIFPLHVLKNTVWREIPFAFFAIVVMFFLANDTLKGGDGPGLISLADSIIMLAFFALFTLYVFYISKITSGDDNPVKMYSVPITVIRIIAGFVGLIIGGNLVVTHSVTIASALGMSEKLIGLTIVAGGTSLPELFTSAIAAYKKRCDIAVGNIVGSNIFNILFILGISGTIKPITYSKVFNTDLYIMFAATILLFITMFTGKKHRLDRAEALILIVCYIGYVVFLIHRN